MELRISRSAKEPFSRAMLVWLAVACVIGTAGLAYAVNSSRIFPSAAQGISELRAFLPASVEDWVGFDGETSAVPLHAILVLTRNVAFALAFAWALVFCLFRGLARERAKPSADGGPNRRNLEENGGRISEELGSILSLLRSHRESSASYSVALGRRRNDLEASKTGDQVRRVVLQLIADNKKVQLACQDYERKLSESQSQIVALRTALAETQERTDRDPLTGVYSRGFFDEALAKEIVAAARQGNPLSLVMADIDCFKSINDTFGHPVGDEVLKNFASVLTDHVRGRDTVVRYGGEEFAIILPETCGRDAIARAEQIRKTLENKTFGVTNGPRIGRITASFGVAEFQASETPAHLLKRADAQLYSSKSNGRNRVS